MISKIHQLLTSPSLTSFPLSKQPKFKFSSSPPPPPPPSKYPKKKQPHVNPPIQRSKKSSHYHIGLYGLIFAACFAAIPMYRLFCQHVGLRGNSDKKVYDFKNKKIVNHKKYVVRFTGTPQPDINWQFQPVEKEVKVATSETAIVFYRLRNKQERAIVGFSTYNISPQEAGLYFSKIQCFCFNQQMINPQEELLLPLFFYLEPELIEDPQVGKIREIKVNYQFYQSKKQDLAKFAANQLRKVEENKRKLVEMRAKKFNMSVDEYEQYLEEKQMKESETLPTIDKSIQLQQKQSSQNQQ